MAYYDVDKRAMYYECGICEAMHRWEFDGDCREDAERFYDVDKHAVVMPWEERLASDAYELGSSTQ